jgi:polar amino acid transport system permease protein
MMRSLVICAIVSFGAGLVFASYGGTARFVPGLIDGALVTVQITVAAAILAIVTALIAALCKLYGPAPVRWLATIYIELFRGTSALVQLFWLFFVLPRFGITLPAMVVGIVALGLHVGAYGAELIRGAISGVARGQWEAATALNMNRATALRRIILPQALVAMIPPWGNLLIELLKLTSLVSLITITDLAFRAQQMNQATFETARIFGITATFYLALAAFITIGMRSLEQAVSHRWARRGP